MFSAAATLGGVVIGVHIRLFYWHSDTVGGNLLNNEQAEIAAGAEALPLTPRSSISGVRTISARRRPPGRCPRAERLDQGLDARRRSATGDIEAKSIGLEAPVLQGVGDEQLNVAVGHVPGSVWPGPKGTTVFSADDVSWFSGIDHLKAGSTVRYVTPCKTYTYKVTSHAVVTAGSPVTNRLRPTLVLDTCYPLDALWITPKRYLEYAAT